MGNTNHAETQFTLAKPMIERISHIVCPLEHVGLQYCGANGVGKSSAAAAVSSIWGGDANPNHRLGSGTAWKNTDNALEQYSTAYSNTLLFLDEADSIVGGDNKAKANALLNVVKDIAGGRGKGRANDPSVSSWFTPILSTSNLSVPRMLELKRRDRDFSYIDRLFDIPPPKNAHGFFENLHGFADKVEFRDRLLELANRNFGVTGRAFVAEIARSLKRDRTGLVAFVRARRRPITERPHPFLHQAATWAVCTASSPPSMPPVVSPFDSKFYLSKGMIFCGPS